MTKKMRVRDYIDFSKRINGEFKIHERIGSGSFGAVYRVQDRNGKSRAAKFFRRENREMFENETSAMPKIRERRTYGAINWHYAGAHGSTYVLVMDLLGDSIWDLHNKFGGLSLKSVLMIGIQLINNLRKLHDRGYIHRDLKPKNIVVGRKGTDRGYVYLIDYGLARKYKDKNGEHKPIGEEDFFYAANAFYPASNASAKRQSRRCDLESLLYVLIFLLKGSLPWDKRSFLEATKAKKTISGETLCHGLPEELKLFFRNVKALGYTERPDYSRLSSYLKIALENAGHTIDSKFEWTE